MVKNTRRISAKLFIVLVAVAVAFVVRVYKDGAYAPVEDTVDQIKLHFIYVGQGDSTLIEGNNANILIDAGPGSEKENLVSYLWDVLRDDGGTESIDYFILTHPHEDHIGGAVEVLENFNVKNVIMPDAVTETRVFSNLLDTLEEQEINVIQAVHGDSYEVGGMKMDIFGPVTTEDVDLNNTSVVMKLTYGNTAMMFTGDAEASEESDILELYERKLSSVLLKVGHHGSSTSSSERFIKAIIPDIAVISCGIDNKFSHPHKETTMRLEEIGAEIYRTDEMGNIVFISDGESIRPE